MPHPLTLADLDALAARSDVPALVAEVIRLRDELRATRGLLDAAHRQLDAALGMDDPQLARTPDWRKHYTALTA